MYGAVEKEKVSMYEREVANSIIVVIIAFCISSHRYVSLSLCLQSIPLNSLANS